MARWKVVFWEPHDFDAWGPHVPQHRVVRFRSKIVAWLWARIVHLFALHPLGWIVVVEDKESRPNGPYR